MNSIIVRDLNLAHDPNENAPESYIKNWGIDVNVQLLSYGFNGLYSRSIRLIRSAQILDFLVQIIIIHTQITNSQLVKHTFS